MHMKMAKKSCQINDMSREELHSFVYIKILQYSIAIRNLFNGLMAVSSGPLSIPVCVLEKCLY